MARSKRQSGPSITTVDVSDLSTLVIQSRDEEEAAVNEDSDQSDLKSPSSPPISKKVKISEKRKPRKSASAKSIPTSPAVTSSSATTPQPEPGPKRKGGNKRKWTHEYCLTCTRYGRACGGRREGEEGCAVCRDPDRSKGEKLRECLWADHEAGVTDYKTAREIFKKAQAEARAQKLKPQSKRQQPNNASAPATTPRISDPVLDSSVLASKESLAAGDLPRTTRPLDLQPPILVRSSYLFQQTDRLRLSDDGTAVVDRIQFAVHPSVASAPHDYLPRIHRPQLTYVAIDSDNEEKTFETAQDSRPGLTSSRKNQASRTHQSHDVPSTYFDADLNAWVKPIVLRNPSQSASRYHTHPYRSAYDAPPVPLSHLVCQGDDSRQPDAPGKGNVNARIPVTPSLDENGTPPRKWSINGSKITSINGYDWKARAWKPSDSLKDGELTSLPNKLESRAPITASISDTSSLSSYVSIDEDNIDGVAAGKSAIQESATDEGRNGAGTDRRKNPLKRKFDDTTTELAGSVRGSDLANSTVLHVNLGNAIKNVPTEVSSRTQDNKRLTTFQQPVAVTFPGEITIQEDEEAGTSSSDSELTSDEGKLKSLPFKLRKLLSRNRITKVIIGDDIFEIRPKTKTTSTKVHKKFSSAGETSQGGTKGKGRAQARKSSARTPMANHVNESDDDDDEEHDMKQTIQARDEEMRTKYPPIKIKLIFKPKPAVDPGDISEATDRLFVAGKTAVDTSALTNDTEMGDA